MPLQSRYADLAMPEISFSDYIFESLNRQRNRVAIVEASTGNELTCGDFSLRAIKYASALTKRGLQKGDVVAMCTLNSPEYLIVMLSVASCGATITTCNPYYTAKYWVDIWPYSCQVVFFHSCIYAYEVPSNKLSASKFPIGMAQKYEMMHQFTDSQPKMIFIDRNSYAAAEKVAGKIGIKKLYSFETIKSFETLDSLLQNEDGSAFPRNVRINPREDILFLPYSSGTTGLPKGVMVTHYGYVATLRLYKMKAYYATDSLYTVLPQYHAFGLMMGFSLLNQGIKHILDVRFNLENMLKYIEKYRVTHFASVPPMLLAMSKSSLLDKYDLSSIVHFSCGAAPISSDVLQVLKTKLGCTFNQGWGMTEILPLALNDDRTPPHSIGRLTANIKLKVINVHTGEDVGSNTEGEICVKGPNMMKGYYKNSAATKRTIDVDGWMHTGDIGYYDENELIYIVDRLKDLIKYKGFQVSPVELEAVLISHPKIFDVAVVGVPDQEAGEVAKAFVVAKNVSLTKQDIHTFLSDKLTKYKHLHGGIEFCNNIPKTASGKILRRAIRESGVQSKL